MELGAFGSLISWAQNAQVTIVVASNGEMGTPKGADRAAEAKRSADEIGAKIIFLGLKDGYIAHNLDTVTLLDNVIRDVEPDTILIHHPDDLHQDHRHVSLSGISAARRVKEILLYETPSTTRSFRPNYWVNITDQIEAKYQILRKHESQSDKPYCTREAIYGIAAYHALSVNRSMSYFEAFELVRSISD